MSIPLQSLVQSVREVAASAVSGDARADARLVLAALQSAEGRPEVLRSVIGGKARVLGAHALTDQAGLEAFLAAPESPAALRLQATTIAAALFNGAAPQGWFAAAMAASCAVLVKRGGVTRLIGSGVAVQADPAVILTNRHVVAGLVQGASGDGLMPGAGVELCVSFGDVAGGPERLVVARADLLAGPDLALLHLAPGAVVPQVPLPAPGAGEVPPDVAVAIGFPAQAVMGDEIRAFRSSGLLGRKVISLGLAGIEGAMGTFAGFDPAVGWHDCATCKGFSGSGVHSVARGGLAGLHFHGGAVVGGGMAGFVNLTVDLRRVTLALPMAPAPVPLVAAPRPAPAPPQADWQGVARALTIQRDLPDPRDLLFQADLADLPPVHSPRGALPVADQGDAPTCVGHALAAAIHLALARRGAAKRVVSARMLYECARAHDDLADDLAPGSTLRGAIKGFFHNGVAPWEEAAETAPGWTLTRARSRAAREVQLGTYRRVARDFDALHAAVRETGAVLASARLHPGWLSPQKGAIRRQKGLLGGHAFVIVGYDRTGFIVLNSWGPDWGGWRGRPGLAHWSYADADASLLDAWVLRLAVPAPAVARIVQRDRAARVTGQLRRADVIGHMLPVSDGRLHTAGKFGFDAQVHAETAAYLGNVAGTARPKYRDLLLVCHDLTADRAQIAARTARLRAAMKPRKVWPLSLALETALGRSLLAVVAQSVAEIGQTDGALRPLRLAEEAGPVVRSLWQRLPEECAAMDAMHPAGQALTAICAAAAPLRLHVMAEGTGALLAGWLLAHGLAGRAVEGLYLLDPALPEADYAALVLPALTRAAPVRRLAFGFAATGDVAGSGLPMADLLAGLLGRAFAGPQTPVPQGPCRMALPGAAGFGGALDNDLTVAALAQLVAGR